VSDTGVGLPPLFECYPSLAKDIPYVSLGQFPTPVERLQHLGRELGIDQLYIKRDDLTCDVYGGNKIRKLEFLVGLALREKRREVMTFGAAGSNHATATAVSAHKVGLRSISMLVPQPNAQYVRDNLLMSYCHGAELHLYGGQLQRRLGVVWQRLAHRVTAGRAPLVIPFGGSSPLGAIGFVNAAFEIKEQIESGQIPEPDRMYVALGSMGTAVGLQLGLRAVGLSTRLTPVRVVPEEHATPDRFVELFRRTGALIRRADPSFPVCELGEEDVEIVHDFFGPGYGVSTPEGTEAIRRAREAEGIKLDRTYTGKTFAALVRAAERGELADEVVLFWLTLNSRDLSSAIADVDYRTLPRSFHRYFEEDVHEGD